MSHTVLNVEQTPPILNTDMAADILSEFDASVVTSTTTDEDELIDLVPGKEGLMVHAGVPVTDRVIEAGEELQVIARCGIGIDNVDLEVAADRTITVVNHPTYSVQEVATHAVSLCLAGFRRIPAYDRDTREGSWAWATGAPMGRLSESTVGLVGFGSIGRRVAVLASGFGCDILATDPYVDDAVMARHNVESVDLQTLCERSHIVSIHAELTDETEGLISADELAADGIGFVGLDVTDPEPLPADHALFEFDNFVATPHAAWYSERSRDELSRDIARDVGRVLNGGQPTNPVID